MKSENSETTAPVKNYFLRLSLRMALIYLFISFAPKVPDLVGVFMLIFIMDVGAQKIIDWILKR